ncbi:hypothetical protein [Desulfopila inferna]|nr:hypothetical protein [Desulfopila inferna]
MSLLQGAESLLLELSLWISDLRRMLQRESLGNKQWSYLDMSGL